MSIAPPPLDHDAQLLTQYLSDRDVACPRCGYNLRALHGKTCPECGDGLQLVVNLIEPRMGPYIALLSAVCLGLGGSALLGLVALVEAPGDWWTDAAGVVLLIQLAITINLLPTVLLMRRRFRRASRGRQITLAIATWAMVLILSGLIVMFFD